MKRAPALSPTRGGAARAEYVAGCALLFAACNRTQAPSVRIEAGSGLTLAAFDGGAKGGDPTALTLPRCVPGPGAAIDPASAGADVEVGDAVPYLEGYAVALVHGGEHGPMAAVGFLDRNEVRLRVLDLGATLGDAPPPRLAVRPGGIVAAAYARPVAGLGDASEDAREVAFYSAGDKAPSILFTLPQKKDDSFALDIAYREGAGVVVWDEASGPGRGVVRLAYLASNDHPGPPRDLSSADSDAELPRVFAEPTGYTALWIARRAEPSSTDGGEVETPGEPRDYGWLEILELDDHGTPSGPVRRLTSANGHIAGFDAQKLKGSGPPTLLVVARDDGEATDGSGGVLLRVRVSPQTLEPPFAFPTDALGRGSPSLVGGEAQLLAWIGAREQMRLLPLDSDGAPAGPISVEEAMSDGRPLLVLDGESDPLARTRAFAPLSGRLLVATPGDRAAAVRTFECRELRMKP